MSIRLNFHATYAICYENVDPSSIQATGVEESNLYYKIL